MKPFIKWAGGKTQLLDIIRMHTPARYSTYYEPFLGGGAVLFDQKPKRAIVSDANEQLIHAYRIIRDNANELIRILNDLDGVNRITQDLYYDKRARYNQLIAQNDKGIEIVALLIWLNHHCFNGLYRTNRKGQFNTPWNRTETCKPSFDEKNILEISQYLNENDVDIRCDDYKNIMSLPLEGDYVFLDPPYDPIGKYGDFKRYTKEQFYEEDQKELAAIVMELISKGVHICLTNSNTDLIRELYKECSITVEKTHRNINSKGKGRFGEDAIITAR